MTSVLAAARPGHHIRNVETDISVALDPTSGRLLSFQRTQDQHRVKFPLVRLRCSARVVLTLRSKSSRTALPSGFGAVAQACSRD